MAKVRYMIDYVFDEARLARGENPYVPCGVWAMSETQFEVAYLPGGGLVAHGARRARD